MSDTALHMAKINLARVRCCLKITDIETIEKRGSLDDLEEV
jgi:hypothetical protein